MNGQPLSSDLSSEFLHAKKILDRANEQRNRDAFRDLDISVMEFPHPLRIDPTHEHRWCGTELGHSRQWCAGERATSMSIARRRPGHQQRCLRVRHERRASSSCYTPASCRRARGGTARPMPAAARRRNGIIARASLASSRRRTEGGVPAPAVCCDGCQKW